jgi:hypothetical protein
VPVGLPPPVTGNGTQARMQRAQDRFDDRQNRNIQVPRKQKFFARAEALAKTFRDEVDATGKFASQTMHTPLGPVQLSKFPLADPGPKITSRKGDFANASVGHTYPQMSKALFPPQTSAKRKRESDAAIADELLHIGEHDARPSKKQQVIGDGEQRNAAAKMLAVAALSEPLRVGGSSKTFRGVLRGIRDHQWKPEDVFESGNPTFSMADTPDTQRRLSNRQQKKLRNEPVKPKHFRELGGNMSDSSDDEY